MNILDVLAMLATFIFENIQMWQNGSVMQKQNLVELPQCLVFHKVGGRHVTLEHDITITQV